jgi:histidyl-tRNA synthetase
LIEEFGGPPTPAFGFAIGIDRTASLIEDKNYIRISPQIFIATVGEKAGEKAFELVDTLRLKGIRVERDYENSSLKSQLRKADRAGVRYTIIIGEDEINKGRAILRNMPKSQQEEIEISRVEEIVSQKLG